MATQIVYQCFKLTLAHPSMDIPYSSENDPYQTAFTNTIAFIKRLNICSSMIALVYFAAVKHDSCNPSLQNRPIEIIHGLAYGTCAGIIPLFILRLNHSKHITYNRNLEHTHVFVSNMHLSSFALSILSVCAFGISEKLAKSPTLSSISYEIFHPFFGVFLVSNAIMNYMREHMNRAKRGNRAT